eukprot:CAMPEP_0184369670 /NCGR_PEP_ID=MMETSP1089-20130417/162375_2 /TAXON_ID=38269 ORGANISM="Gloeochaete wittrockiana, Strain SAG46.84" /NCGR_SAMPLE_ID=MMETSP1089 /ASSEMBLY_ACC=CAM_ASM_000445 /LENGTH=339 /DNA_ID= /DNA_START= /DNA_END= /DNA_ORIENTATION=
MNRRALYEAAISSKDFEKIRHLAFEGLPETGDSSLRAVYWKILLRYLPTEKDKWAAFLTSKRAEYKLLVQCVTVNPSETSHPDEKGHFETVDEDHHPLSTNTSSPWSAFFKDKELVEQINRDVLRTHPDLHMFSQESHRDALKRILLVYAKTSPVKYVQGMNEILAPIYYVFCSDTKSSTAGDPEADSFFCLVGILADIGDRFSAKMDSSHVGVKGILLRLSTLLKRADHDLYYHMRRLKVSIQFFAFRWVTLLLSQELSLPDLLRVWDSVFAADSLAQREDRFEFLLFICCSMIIHVREQLLAGDFATVIKTLQHYPPIDISIIIHEAVLLRDKLRNS